MDSARLPEEAVGRENAFLSEVEEPKAWELVDGGRYLPRRVRGSFHGRVLG